MGRPRKRDKHLPACVYYRHGAYYYVRQGKWVRLGTDFPAAMQEYAYLRGTSGDDVVSLIDRTLSKCAERCKPVTLKQYRVAAERIQHAFAEFRVAQVKPWHVNAFMDHWRRTPNFANRMRSLLKMAMDDAAASGLRDDNPVTQVGRFDEAHRTRYMTDAEWDAIYAQASEQLRVMMLIAYYTAQRISDVLAIRLDDVRSDGVIFRQQKTGQRLMVEMSPGLRDAIQRAKRLQSTQPIYLLGKRDGQPRKYSSTKELLGRAAKAARVEDIGWHDIRAKSITDAKAQGLDAQALAGHTNEAQTRRYLRGKEIARVQGPSF